MEPRPVGRHGAASAADIQLYIAGPAIAEKKEEARMLPLKIAV
jgi:hypothetical protein